ncbi:THUMP-like domain-containing protein [Flavobacterium restrictum]|uniref:Class I SAM-dependent methyltransferase n=1 Tax=Flavobacterium restrictum TaxID=2594428 RepID=A0A553E764_9FLAO|nr:class I SAM-dependent methyltransferase [Flavobacterium restrictum]TRX40859.1 class I SAM-dependent methyltransferase [Flavobacterium restrictum]
MDLKILNPDVQAFINNSIAIEVSKLALQKNPFPDLDWIAILNQIEAKAKAKNKLPTWFNTPSIFYPSKISIEQTSSEKTADYKSKIVSGNSLIDLTGGFGVDDYYFAQQLKTVVHCEINTTLSTIVAHNFKQLAVQNMSCYAGDSAAILKKMHQKWDWIYIDPSRRNDAKGKVFMLQDCLPNVPENLDFYFENAPSILIKTAPLLDLSAGLLELKNVKTIHIIALENEVKELLWELHHHYNGEITLKTVNITKDKNETFDFVWNAKTQVPTFGLPQNYLYEPNSAVMKSGGFDEIGVFYNLKKLHKQSHLYTSEMIIDFPGRIFEIQKVIPYGKNDMKRNLENTKTNITTRNFPDSVESIRKKWKIKEGGNTYCFFTTTENNHKIVLICTKIK